MRPVSRSPVNKGQSSKRFSNQTRTTKAANMHSAPMRGGYRL
jgi:hypothetical protein